MHAAKPVFFIFLIPSFSCSAIFQLKAFCQNAVGRCAGERYGGMKPSGRDSVRLEERLSKALFAQKNCPKQPQGG
jgi:hypothetical protein